MQLQIRGYPGTFVQCFVGADDPVRPMGTIGFADGFRKTVGAYRNGPMWSSAPTNILRVCIGAYVFVTSYHTGGVEPLPYVHFGGFYVFAGGASHSVRSYRGRTGSSAPTGVRSCSHWYVKICNIVPHGRGKPLPYVTTKNVHQCKRTDRVIGPRKRCPNHETKPGKLVAFRASAGLGRRGRPLAPTHTPPGERCRVPLRQSAAIADSAGHTAPSVLQAWLSVKAPLPCACRTIAPVCVWKIGILALESTAALCH